MISNGNIPLTSDAARDFIRANLPNDARLAITGASGWLGRTLVSLLAQDEVPMLCLGSKTRAVELYGSSFQVYRFERKLVESFKPTVLVDFATLTREKRGGMDASEYTRVNEELLESALNIFSLETVRSVIFTSSGVASIARSDDSGVPSEPYAEFKVKTEDSFLISAERLGKSALGLRPWSVSGPMVTKPSTFAFSSIMTQALAGQVAITADRPVNRRYVSVDDLLAIGFGLMSKPGLKFEMIDSGGELVEIQELAEKAFKHLGTSSRIHRELSPNQTPDNYYSDNSSWESAIRYLNYQPESLDQQIARTLQGLSAIMSANEAD